jgi:hypothetical protein
MSVSHHRDKNIAYSTPQQYLPSPLCWMLRSYFSHCSPPNLLLAISVPLPLFFVGQQEIHLWRVWYDNYGTIEARAGYRFQEG